MVVLLSPRLGLQQTRTLKSTRTPQQRFAGFYQRRCRIDTKCMVVELLLLLFGVLLSFTNVMQPLLEMLSYTQSNPLPLTP
jgi:hypothetical protein